MDIMPMPAEASGPSRVTAADIARRLGISRPTVSTILSGSKSNLRGYRQLPLI